MDNHIITKFTTVVPYACMSMCTKFGKKRDTFAELHSNPWNIPSTQERGKSYTS